MRLLKKGYHTTPHYISKQHNTIQFNIKKQQSQVSPDF